MTKDEALDLALEALEASEYYIHDLEAIVYAADDLGTDEDRTKMQEAITAIKQARSAPVQSAERGEPVAWAGHNLDDMCEAFDRVIEEHASRKNPFHDPVNKDAMIALRILRGFVPYMKRYTTPPVQPAPVQEPVRWSDYEPDGRRYPAVPDAFGTREGEHPQYIQGWNDCRQAMLEVMK